MFYNKKGFTLTELSMVIAVAAILMAVAIPTFIGARNRADTNACVANLEIIKSAIKEWALDNPSSLISHNVVVGEIDDYIDDANDVLNCDHSGSYVTDVTSNGVTTDDIVVQTDAGGNIPDPTCSLGGNHVID